LLEVDAGTVKGTWSQLLNPQTAIPEPVQLITGISAQLVSNEPVFIDIADNLYSMLEGRVFVAHNARFDFGFLKNSFKRCGYQFSPQILCTVKLSRLLNPGFPSHKLDYLIEHYALNCRQRHRAMDDAMLLWDLFKCWIDEHGLERVNDAILQVIKTPSLPVHLNIEDINSIPDKPGIYRFYDENDALLYVGKSVRLKTRVKSHFSSDYSSNKEMKLARQVRRIDYQRTAGDFSAQLLESSLIKKHRPLYNQRLRKKQRLTYFIVEQDASGYLCLHLKSSEKLPDNPSGRIVGLFRSKRAALAKLTEWAKKYHLCQRLLGLEKKKTGPCFAYQLKHCHGACCGEESSDDYNHRLLQVIDDWYVNVWPYAGPVIFEEHSDDISNFHLVDQWCHLDMQEHKDQLSLKQNNNYDFDYDAYKLLQKAFLSLPADHIYPLSPSA